jgi:hypothetical protein
MIAIPTPMRTSPTEASSAAPPSITSFIRVACGAGSSGVPNPKRRSSTMRGIILAWNAVHLISRLTAISSRRSQLQECTR